MSRQRQVMPARRFAILMAGSLCMLLLSSVYARAEIPSQIRVCDKASEWPPYAYNVRKQGRETAEVTGYSIRFLRTILDAHHISAAVELRPWRRCQQDVIAGSFAMLLDASVNEERRSNFLVSKAYYLMDDVYFYAKGRPAPKVATTADLRKLRLCGQVGTNYSNYGLRDEEIDASAPSLPLAMEKLKAGRCDVVLARLEIAAGHRFTTGTDYSKSADFGWSRLPGMAPATFHMMVSRQLPYGQALLELLNRGIDEMVESKKGEQLAREFLQ